MENVKLALEVWELCWFVQQWKWVFHLHWLLNYLASRMKQAIFGMQTKCATVFIVFLSNFIQREPTTDKFTKTHIYLTCFSFFLSCGFVCFSLKENTFFSFNTDVSIDWRWWWRLSNFKEDSFSVRQHTILWHLWRWIVLLIN